ncbi:MAG: OmpH family outer membrane protein [Chlorobi bacterium]|nr:OmpH family outer membrane protein [Chlorobiota bacterium]
MKKILLLPLILWMAVACRQPEPEKTAYIDLNEVVKEYKLMKDIQKEFEAKQEAFTRKYDSLGLALQQQWQEFQQKSRRMSPKKAEQEYNRLLAEQQNLQLLQQQEFNRLQEDFNRASQEATDKLKAFVEEYGKTHGYTYIFSRSELAGVAYGKEEKNITKEFIEALNAAEK